jgi:hypothetical protein
MLLLAHIAAAAGPSRTILYTPIIAERCTPGVGCNSLSAGSWRFDGQHQGRKRDQGKSGLHPVYS